MPHNHPPVQSSTLACAPHHTHTHTPSTRSITQASTVRIGTDPSGNSVYVPMKNLVPLVEPNDLVIGGWDISKMNLGDSMRRAKVLDVSLQDQLYDHMKDLVPLPSIYFPDFIAANQADRADNVLTGSKFEQMEQIRRDIREFKARNGLDKVVVLWTANTERFAAIEEGINDTADNLIEAIKRGEVRTRVAVAVVVVLAGCVRWNREGLAINMGR